MSKERSSFHMGDEFNGYGGIRYLKGTQHAYHPPLSQENVHLSPNFKMHVLKLLGSIPVVISPASINPILLSLLGTMTTVNRVIVTKDELTGNYVFKFNVTSKQDFTDGSYPYTIYIEDNQVPTGMGVLGQWVEAGEPLGSKWKYYRDGKFINDSWVESGGRKYYVDSDGFMITGWYKKNGDWYYFKSNKEKERETAGHMAIHWQEIEYIWYYFHGDGKMAVSDWAQDSKGTHWYYLRSNGEMAKSQVREWKGKLYYLEDDGAMAVNKQITDPNTGKKYQANSDGVLSLVVVNSPLYNDIASKVSQITNINSKFNTECNKFSNTFFKYQQRYEKIAAIVGVPPALIAVIHYRENSKDFFAGTFNVYLHNGDPLGKPTVHEPKGISFSNFDDAAVHAINMKKTYITKYNLSYNSDDIVAMMAFAEVYNGLGYYNSGHVSPYLYSGTNVYVSGKYTSDGSYNPSAVDKQAGVYILLDAIL